MPLNKERILIPCRKQEL